MAQIAYTTKEISQASGLPVEKKWTHEDANEVKTVVNRNDYWRGAHSIAGGQYPSSGGTGDGGAPYPGNTWYTSDAGILNVDGLGNVRIEAKVKITYIGGDVTLPSSWIVTQN